MAKPNKKAPSKAVNIFCAKCGCKLYRYRKGGKGALVKCFKERITEDYTSALGVCPDCESVFGRDTLIKGAPAIKMIGGKVRMK
ncbi:hypothetical protein J4N45_22445 [Vibrio sp. SCSIO 43140]|uniref:hypothetical protein n=1 Tax=Vibrio sp. SCSIO 43140 TaxID=2819100 RepID=UPI0020763959|nr:hypothetical protein [Vibrio sp. SCSIO 43140]USD63730.1 hypothetical protein J4N45_22445 [Vibrio sp. SCSIO 43140]